MKVVFIKNNNYKNYKNLILEGYKFTPKRKNINSLLIVNKSIIKNILNKRIRKDLKNIDKAIKLMIKSNITEIQDCIIMENEINRIINNLDNKYIKYFNEFEYYDFIKNIYVLNNVINLKKNLIINQSV